MADVSTATVSYVINNTRNVKDETRRRVVDAIEKLGYQPNQVAKSLRMKKTNNIGVLVEDIMGFSTSSIINGISEFVEQSGYHILLNDLRMLNSLYNRYDQITQQKDRINNAMSLLIFGAKVDAVIYVGMFDRDISGIINKIDKPLIIAYSTTSDDFACSVTYENEDIAANAVKYLIDSGHRRIAVITGLAHTSPSRMRMRGVHRAFREAGLTLESEYVKNGDWEYVSGYSCTAELLEQKRILRPTAMFVMNDLMAVGAMDAIRDAGLRIPDDISIIGFDNREIASMVQPRLTTVEIDLRGIGYVAAQVVISKIGGSGKYVQEKNVVIPSKLILRDTVKALQVENDNEGQV